MSFEKFLQRPGAQIRLNSYHVMFYGHAMLISEIFIFFSGLSLKRGRSNSEKLTRFKIATDILMAFAGGFFTEELEDTESL